MLTLLVLWVPSSAPIYWLGRDPNWVSIVTLVLLYGEFIILVRLWGKYVYRQPQVLRHFGLEITRRNGRNLLKGLNTGLISLVSLFLVEGWLGWLKWQPTPVFLPQVILEGLIVALAIGFAEELLFRGWLLDELQRDYHPRRALWMNALLFASLHFIKPLQEIFRTLPQFAGLLLLGLILVWAKRQNKNRLGLPIGLHAGLVWGYYIINVGQLVQYSGQVPDWITGFNSNPLAGVMGLLFLSVLALWIRRRSQLSTPSRTYFSRRRSS